MIALDLLARLVAEENVAGAEKCEHSQSKLS